MEQTTRHPVMVIDDDETIRHVLEVRIRLDDRLELAGSFAEATTALPAIAESAPHAIICDVQMPGLNGLDALPLLRAVAATSAIVLYTAYPEGIAGAAAGSADGVASKDMDLSSLIDLVAHLTERRQCDVDGAAQPAAAATS